MEQLKKLKEEYPIGCGVNREEKMVSEIRHYYSQQDLNIFHRIYETVRILNDSLCEVSYIEVSYDIVNGYLFDGKNWQLVTEDCDGWQVIKLEKEDV